MKSGVVLDIQRQEMRKRQNVKQAQDQIELTKALKEQQQQLLASSRATASAT